MSLTDAFQSNQLQLDGFDGLIGFFNHDLTQSTESVRGEFGIKNKQSAACLPRQ